MAETFESRLARHYPSLSARLSQAAEYILAHPVDVATRSLRAVSREAELAPATFTRLSKALGYESFEALRDVMRVSVGYRVNFFSERAKQLQNEQVCGEMDFRTRHLAACASNIQNMVETLPAEQIEQAVSVLQGARQVCVAGELGSTGVAEYLVYMADYFAENWRAVSGPGASLGNGLTGMDQRDVLIVITKPPFATNGIRAAELARELGAYVIVITDTISCPALAYASSSFIIPTQSPHFFSSYASTLAFCEMIIGMLAGTAGPKARLRIEAVEKNNRHLGLVWDG